MLLNFIIQPVVISISSNTTIQEILEFQNFVQRFQAPVTEADGVNSKLPFLFRSKRNEGKILFMRKKLREF